MFKYGRCRPACLFLPAVFQAECCFYREPWVGCGLFEDLHCQIEPLLFTQPALPKAVGGNLHTTFVFHVWQQTTIGVTCFALFTFVGGLFCFVFLPVPFFEANTFTPIRSHFSSVERRRWMSKHQHVKCVERVWVCHPVLFVFYSLRQDWRAFPPEAHLSVVIPVIQLPI